MTRRYLILIALLFIFVLAIGIPVLAVSHTEDTLRIFISVSAKISVILFSIAFSISSFHYFLKNSITQRVLKLRPEIGLSFMVFHSAHLGFLIYLQMEFHPVFELAKLTSLIGGGLAYIFMYLMALTTFESVKAKMSSRSWNILHLVGGYWIWFIFFRTYGKSVLNEGENLVLFGIILLVFIARIAKLIARIRQRSSISSKPV